MLDAGASRPGPCRWWRNPRSRCHLPVTDRRVHGIFLRLPRTTRPMSVRHVPRSAKRASCGADLAAYPHRLQWPGGLDRRRLGHAGHAPAGAAESAGCRGPQRRGPSRKLDIEVELGALVGTPHADGPPIARQRRRTALFGYVLLNDWSARDIQVWEYQPLGPVPVQGLRDHDQPSGSSPARPLEPFRREAPEREKPAPSLPAGGYAQQSRHREITATLAPRGRRPRADPFAPMPAGLYYSAGAAAWRITPCRGAGMEAGRSSGVRHHIGPTSGQLRLIALETDLNGTEPSRVDGGKRGHFWKTGDTVTLTGTVHRSQGSAFGTCKAVRSCPRQSWREP